MYNLGIQPWLWYSGGVYDSGVSKARLPSRDDPDEESHQRYSRNTTFHYVLGYTDNSYYRFQSTRDSVGSSTLIIARLPRKATGQLEHYTLQQLLSSTPSLRVLRNIRLWSHKEDLPQQSRKVRTSFSLVRSNIQMDSGATATARLRGSL